MKRWGRTRIPFRSFLSMRGPEPTKPWRMFVKRGTSHLLSRKIWEPKGRGTGLTSGSLTQSRRPKRCYLKSRKITPVVLSYLRRSDAPPNAKVLRKWVCHARISRLPLPGETGFLDRSFFDGGESFYLQPL